MFKRIQFWWLARRLNRKYEAQILERWIGSLGELDAKLKPGTKIDEAELNEERLSIDQTLLFIEAARLRVSVPTTEGGEELFIPGEVTGLKIMRSKYYAVLRDRVRGEKRERREQALAFVTPFTGIMGVIVGSVLTWLLLGS